MIFFSKTIIFAKGSEKTLMKVIELATELTLKTLLIELTRDGVRYAQLSKEFSEKNMQKASVMNHDQLSAVSNVLASILPGVCTAQVQQGFKNFAATDVFPYGHMDENDFEGLLAAIDLAWKKEELKCSEASLNQLSDLCPTPNSLK